MFGASTLSGILGLCFTLRGNMSFKKNTLLHYKASVGFTLFNIIRIGGLKLPQSPIGEHLWLYNPDSAQADLQIPLTDDVNRT